MGLKWNYRKFHLTYFSFIHFENPCIFALAEETEEDAGKLWKLGKVSFLMIGMTYVLVKVIWWISCKMGQPTTELQNYRCIEVALISKMVFALECICKHNFTQS